MFLSIKDKRTGKASFKGRFVVERYKARMKQSVIYNKFVSRQKSTKFVVQLAVISGFEIHSFDVVLIY